ncbi:MAG: bifunctional diaminohydroxyphosphoribosylaminopyrimidine deaminase/5-amino-6-(5-phosphoribosylamino)uracil reductase RibD [Lachnospiraceae bacterium]
MTDKEYMQRALSLAQMGCGWVAPNPMVGAVIVKDGVIIGEGYHQVYGQAHAERNALEACKTSPKGAVLYVTLEPCCHQGKQPPCVEAILEAGIRKVVIGSCDPNPLVAGKGVQILKEQGVEVTEGILQEECDAINRIFFHYIQTGLPFVTMKYAMTLDGKIAAHTGASKWITGEIAREHVQAQRHKHTGIMVGVGTVLADDPMLNCRLEGGKNPVRIICDTHLRTPLTAKAVTTAKEISTIIATCEEEERIQLPYLKAGCRILKVGKKEGRIDLRELMEKLGEEKIDSILLEGGGTLNWSALESGIVNQIQAYIAPKLFGGREARTPIEGRGVSFPNEAVKLTGSRIISLGEDILIESEVKGNVYGNC